MPSQCDCGRAAVAATKMKGKNGKPSHDDKNGYDPSGHHLTDRFSKLRRPALSADAISSHGPRLHLILGVVDAELCHHGSVRSGWIVGYFAIAWMP